MTKIDRCVWMDIWNAMHHHAQLDLIDRVSFMDDMAASAMSYSAVEDPLSLVDGLISDELRSAIRGDR